jgi:tRNA/tmRNA/rRNA uracil-C5-methylase (TrmA/RlmC/RlmD family)
MLTAGQTITLDVERPVAGGRMLARHDGQVVLVSGAIPGERVAARVERAARSVAHADTVEVLVPSPDRRPAGDWRCGGREYAHIAYERQRALKADVIGDAFRRIGRLPLSAPPEVMASPEAGYRLRARFHVANGRLGFFREGSHALCEAAATGQLSDGAVAWLAAAQQALTPRLAGSLVAVELAENVPGSERAVHVEVREAVDRAALAVLGDGIMGLSAHGSSSPAVDVVAGSPLVTESLLLSDNGALALLLSRNVRSFFQGNRFLLESLLRHVLSLLAPGPLADLYAGVGLFGLAAAAMGQEAVTLVEGDPTSGADLESNARVFGDRVRVIRRSVEAALTGRLGPVATCLVDPPRTGLSDGARAGVIRLAAPRVVYVSCDVATLARDSRALVDAGYGLTGLTAVDLFPATAHIETVAVFDREVR